MKEAEHRQIRSSHNFTNMKFAYADPPYIGQAKKHYSHDKRCAEVNHTVLIGYLMDNYDGWALSCSSTSLKQILSLETCPNDIRVASWVKPFASFKPNVNPAYCWEPVLFYGAKKRDRSEPTIRDFVIENITLKKGLSGVKPFRFSIWLFRLLGIDPRTDSFDDIFPGSGSVGAAYDRYTEMITGEYKQLTIDGCACT